jgi:steroid 5-alpha reductase family enzyme
MGWNYLGIFLVISLVLCLVGFYKYVYFLSIGYGFSVAGIGVALAVMSLMGVFEASLAHYILFILFVVYGIRLSGFLLIRELKNVAYRKTLKEATGDEKAMPMFVKVSIWLCVAVLYVAQTSPVFFRMLNGGAVSAFTWAGIIICICGIGSEAWADEQKSAQKKVRPDMVATQGLYKIVRCPNYFGEILFWTGVFVSSLDILTGAGQWIMAIVSYICIVFIMFNGAQRLEKRQMKRYGKNKEYNDYANKTPIIIPFLPIYHLNKVEK